MYIFDIGRCWGFDFISWSHIHIQQ